MKIVHIITRLIIGGAQENTILTCRALLERGHQVILLTGPETGREGEMFGTAKSYGLQVRGMSSLCRNIHPLKDGWALLQLVRALGRIKPDVVHTHSSKAGILGRLAARLVGTRIVVHTIHGLPFFRYQNPVVRRMYVIAERLAARWADKLVTVGDDMARQAVQVQLGSGEDFLTVYSGLDGPSFFPNRQIGLQVRRRLGIPVDAFVVGKLARLAPLKGHKYFLDAVDVLARKHPKLCCLLVGEGQLREQIEDRLEGSGLAGRVRLAGLVPPEDVPRMLWAMDMLAHTSLHEGLPRAVVQGLLAGLPVAAFDLDGAREVIQPGKTGYLIEPESVSQLIQAIEDTMAGVGTVRGPSPSQRAELAERFSWRRMAQSLEDLYNSLADR